MRSHAFEIWKKTFTLPILLIVLLFVWAPVEAAKKQCVWTDIDKIIAIGDIHGAYDNFVKILKWFGLIDENLRWIGGKTHLVQTGDIMDRGDKPKQALDLLRRLEEEAEKDGGMVHLLLGNHEEMNITGISLDYAGYVSAEQFVSFLPEKFRERKEKDFLKEIGGKAKNPINMDLSSNEDLRKFWEGLMTKDIEAKNKYINHFNDKYGKWLLKHNTVIKINDVIFCHGGISLKFSTWTLEDINETTSKELNFLRMYIKRPELQQRPFELKIVYKPDGPLWWRGLALMDDETFEGEVQEILQNLGANYMVVAHTPKVGSPVIGNEELSRYKGKIWVIDTGISHFPGGKLAALIIKNGNFNIEVVPDEN